MAGIDFYILDSSGLDRRHVACQISEKAYKRRHRVYIRVDNEQEQTWMDEKLWTFRTGSFVPHCLHASGSEPLEVPVLIGQLPAPESHQDVLINLTSQVPEDYPCYARVIEIIDAAGRDAGRRRYKTYKASGHDIKTHKI